MKLLTIFCLCFVLMFFDCSSKKNKSLKSEAKKSKAEKNMSEFLSFTNEADGIEYSFKAELKEAGEHNGIDYKNDFVEIEYELNNTSEKDYIVFNKGHFGTNSYTVYVEPGKGGTVEISQKAFGEPKDRKCPARFVAISPLASMFNSKDKITEKVQIEMPLQTRTPYDDCEPKPEVPKDVKEVRFCIGVMEANSDDVKLGSDGRVQGMTSMKEQKLLCSDFVSLG